MVLSQSTMHKGKHLFLFLLSLVTVPKSCISMLEDGYFLQLSRLRLRSPHQLSFSMFKETECCLRCLQYTGCKSVNFDMRDGTCEINFFGPQSHGVKTEVNQSWALYYKPNGKKRVICFYVLSFFFFQIIMQNCFSILIDILSIWCPGNIGVNWDVAIRKLKYYEKNEINMNWYIMQLIFLIERIW